MAAEYGSSHGDQPPVLLLHGFDSSSLEFRRLIPLMEAKLETWAVDLVGWGFSDSGAARHKDMKLGPKQKRDHLYAFWKEKVMQIKCHDFGLFLTAFEGTSVYAKTLPCCSLVT